MRGAEENLRAGSPIKPHGNAAACLWSPCGEGRGEEAGSGASEARQAESLIQSKLRRVPVLSNKFQSKLRVITVGLFLVDMQRQAPASF